MHRIRKQSQTNPISSNALACTLVVAYNYSPLAEQQGGPIRKRSMHKDSI
jgi:hypothetical protein